MQLQSIIFNTYLLLFHQFWELHLLAKKNITYSPISILFKNFIPVSSTSRGRNLFLPGSYCSFRFHFPWKEHVNSNTIVKYLYSTQFAVVSLVLRITASCKGKYLLNHAFQLFFQFLPVQVEETYFFRDGLNRGLIRFLPPGGRNLPTLISWEWRCSWSSADRRCSNYIWVISHLIPY